MCGKAPRPSGMDPSEALLLRSKRLDHLPAWAREVVKASAEPLAEAEAAQVAHRIVTFYGGPMRLRLIVRLFEARTPIDDVAREFDVTKQRISQWQRALGFVEEKFVPRKVVAQALVRGSAYDPP